MRTLSLPGSDHGSLVAEVVASEKTPGVMKPATVSLHSETSGTSPSSGRETPDSAAATHGYLQFMDSAAGLACYLAEWYTTELTEKSVEEIVAKLDAAARTVTDEGRRVRLLVTLAVPTDEVLYGVFDAASADIVTSTCHRAGLPHQRLSGLVGTRIRQCPSPSTPATSALAHQK
jgi:hypothetical protein